MVENVEVISHNIANMSTTGYKRSRAEFQDLMYQAERRVGAPTANSETLSPAGVQVGLGVRTAAITRVHEQGSLTRTDNRFDLAIEGRGWFVVNVPGQDQPSYTRSGAFGKAPNGEIVTADGYQVSPGIIIPENARDVSISGQGEVYVYTADNPDPQLVGQLDMALFVNDAGLEAQGDNLFRQTAASGEPVMGVPGDANAGMGSISQGFVEASNVNVVEEITHLIAGQRAYEMNSKVIESADQMLSTAANIR